MEGTKGGTTNSTGKEKGWGDALGEVIWGVWTSQRGKEREIGIKMRLHPLKIGDTPWETPCDISLHSNKVPRLLCLLLGHNPAVSVDGFPGSQRSRSSPWPSLAPVMASLALPKPSSRHTTLADTRFQLSSHTVPHSPFFSTSTRPSPVLAPPFSLTRGCCKRRTQEWEIFLFLSFSFFFSFLSPFLKFP